MPDRSLRVKFSSEESSFEWTNKIQELFILETSLRGGDSRCAFLHGCTGRRSQALEESCGRCYGAVCAAEAHSEWRRRSWRIKLIKTSSDPEGSAEPRPGFEDPRDQPIRGAEDRCRDMNEEVQPCSTIRADAPHQSTSAVRTISSWHHLYFWIR
eukprot:Skav214559  [mRNA]  locus=scaffold285:163889:164353:- [translate_table: standard]